MPIRVETATTRTPHVGDTTAPLRAAGMAAPVAIAATDQATVPTSGRLARSAASATPHANRSERARAEPAAATDAEAPASPWAPTLATTDERLAALAALTQCATLTLSGRFDAIGRDVTPLRNGALTADAGAVRAATGRIQREVDEARAACATLAALTQALTTPLRPTQLEAADLLMAIIPRWKTLAPSHSFELALIGAEPTILADAERVEQAIMALLAYTVALAPEGGDVRVTLRERRAEAPSPQVVERSSAGATALDDLDARGGGAIISVRSQQGQALPAAALAQLAEPFYQAPGLADALTGSDLGLRLAQTIAAQHGGALWAEVGASENDAPTLHLALPFTLPAQTAAAREDAAPSDTTNREGDANLPLGRLALTRAQPITLLVEGDPRMARYLRANLEAQRQRVVSAATLDEALHLIDLEEPDLLLLDTNLAESAPLDALQRLLAYTGAPIIALARASDPAQCARALDLGAADFVAQPFSMDELLARVRAALRAANRAQAAQREADREPIFASGDLRIDFAQRLVTVSGVTVSLSKTEYKLLRALAQHAGMALTHETLLERVWGPAYSQEVEFIWVYVRRLRRKIEPDAAHPQFILTVPGVGYRLARL